MKPRYGHNARAQISLRCVRSILGYQKGLSYTVKMGVFTDDIYGDKVRPDDRFFICSDEGHKVFSDFEEFRKYFKANEKVIQKMIDEK